MFNISYLYKSEKSGGWVGMVGAGGNIAQGKNTLKNILIVAFVQFVTNSQSKPQQTPSVKSSVEKHAHPSRVVYCAMYSTHTNSNYKVGNLHIYIYSTLLHYSSLREVPSLGLGTTWVRQLGSDSCHYPTAATKCNEQPS